MEAANGAAVEGVQVGREWYGTGAGRKVGLFWGGFMKPFLRLSMAANPHRYGERGWQKQLTRSEKRKVKGGIKRNERGVLLRRGFEMKKCD